MTLYLHQVKTSTSTEILQLDEKLNVVRVECTQLKDSKVGVAMVLLCCHSNNLGGRRMYIMCVLVYDVTMQQSLENELKERMVAIQELTSAR